MSQPIVPLTVPKSRRFDKVGERISPLTHIRFPANQVDLT